MGGIYFFETYAPVVHWTTVRLILIIEVLLVFKSKQGDLTTAFLHAEITKNEKVYVEMTRGFDQFSKNGLKKYLKLKKTIYGLNQIPRTFWKYLTNKLEHSGMKQSKFDPRIFVGEKVTCIVYVDDIIFWARNQDDIHNLAMHLR